jgi:hypothetical protein
MSLKVAIAMHPVDAGGRYSCCGSGKFTRTTVNLDEI